jgi:hypothetical protein
MVKGDSIELGDSGCGGEFIFFSALSCEKVMKGVSFVMVCDMFFLRCSDFSYNNLKSFSKKGVVV